ncbi:PREDICTED: uncharacterized protein LOC105559506 [Vollenhovia emeryi]|uniref:uncharacterized protein LOC105559506 n=1 Tax=Vollenhovia emeryi TaxID=411798 RepID=UPI0005F3D663|nr:PREDICTED: uncharacterized protein LOC105559506 [Vollenhovia emeryi]
MAADCVADGDYLGEYSRFFAEFVARVNPDDQLPVKVSVYDVGEGELVGEIINVTLQYLNRIYCPPSLQSYITRLVIQAIKSTCKKQPEICGLRQQEKTYAPLKLMQAVTNEVNEICRRYLDNSRLALLPPPSSTPQVTVGAIRNARRKMEDRHMILHDLNTMFNIQDDTIVDYYAVFDGHGGQDAAAYCATHLHQYLVESVHYPTDPESALRDAFLTTDAQFIAKSSTQKLNGGSTAICALLINKKLYIAWVGDSMASLVTCGNVKQLVNPHRPTREDESERIRSLGGVIVHCMGVLRVNGFLSISRAIGDVPYKPYISGEPEVRCVPLDGTEDFLIIACDGLWDYVDQRTAALRVYRQVLQNPYDLKHVHQALLQSAKRAGSLDNITVIVVFLTPPIEIAARSNPLPTHQAPNGLLLNNMDPNNPIPSNHDQFDVKPACIKPDFDMDLLLKNNTVCEVARNGKHRDDDDDEYDYGPETDVDAGEDVHDNNYPLAATSSLEPTPEADESPSPVAADDDKRNDNDYSNRDNANVCPVDSVVGDGDVDNRVRSSDRDVRGADDETPRDHGDGDTRVETAATHTVVDDDDESPPSPRAANPLQQALIVADNVADSEDSEDEWDYYRVDPNKQQGSAAAAVAADESRKDIEAQSAQENPESVAKDSSEVESPEAANDIKCEELLNTSLHELIDYNISYKENSSESEKEQVLLDLQEDKEQDNMDFQLNPEAAEFVPNLPSPPLLNARDILQDFAISGSPLKQAPTMDDISIPSQSEFDKEVCYRPKEIGEEFSHGGVADLPNNTSQNMDVSEISSTKAEMGDDESMMHAMSTSQWQSNLSSQWNEKPGDDAGSDLDENDIVTKDNPMTMSLAPGNFMAVFEKDVDLNAVHMLDDSSDGAEQANTPPRSPEPYANDRAHTPLLEEKAATDVLRASTPQPSDENSVSTVSSEISSETKASSLSATMPEKESDLFLTAPTNPFSSLAKNTIHNMPGIDVEGYYSSSDELQVKDDCSTQFEKPIEEAHEESAKLTEGDKEEEKEKLCKLEDDKDIFTTNPAEQSLRNYSDIIQEDSIQTESEMPKTLPDSTNYSNFNDEIQDSKQHILQQPFEKMHPETVYRDNFSSEIVYEKVDVFQQKSADAAFTFEDDACFFKDRRENEKLFDTDKDDDIKPDSTTNSNLSDPTHKSVEDELQHKNQMFDGHVPIEAATLIDKPTEQEQAETKAVEFALINVAEEKVVSEGIPLKEEENEPRETARASPEGATTLDKSKEATGITNASVGAVVVATVAAAAIAGTAKAKTPTSAKRPMKTTTSRATAVSTTKTLTKSTPTSPSKTISAATRATTTSAAQTVAKKSATSTATRPKQLDGSAKAAVSSPSARSTVTKTATSKVATTAATRTSTSPRVSSGAAKPKTTTTTLSKVNNGAPIEKKTTMSGDAKSISKPASAKPTSATLRTTVTSTTARTALVKTTSTTAKTSAPSATLKPRPASATTAARATTTTTKQSLGGVNGTSRPRTAPTSGGATRPREIAGKTSTIAATKSPLIDKQSKETVNKQISRSGASAPRLGGRATVPTGATKARTSGKSSTGSASATSPTKRTLTSKTASKSTSAVTKRVSPSEAKVVQNGILKEDMIITATSKPEDDVPRKDASPVNVPTDNQLIAD